MKSKNSSVSFHCHADKKALICMSRFILKCILGFYFLEIEKIVTLLKQHSIWISCILYVHVITNMILPLLDENEEHKSFTLNLTRRKKWRNWKIIKLYIICFYFLEIEIFVTTVCPLIAWSCSCLTYRSKRMIRLLHDKMKIIRFACHIHPTRRENWRNWKSIKLYIICFYFLEIEKFVTLRIREVAMIFIK